jgi:hypothetical protein
MRKYAPIKLPPIRAGEIDGRYIDLTSDLGEVGDSIPTMNNVFLTFRRLDGFTLSPDDLQLAGQDWPNMLDPSGLILTIGLTSPLLSAGMRYRMTLTVNKTLQNRLFISDMTIDVLASMG